MRYKYGAKLNIRQCITQYIEEFVGRTCSPGGSRRKINVSGEDLSSDYTNQIKGEIKLNNYGIDVIIIIIMSYQLSLGHLGLLVGTSRHR